MCGIAGFLQTNGFVATEMQNSFAESLKHRGPDHIGIHKLDQGFILNTRLSIIDLGGGNQPFYSKDHSIAVIQNGEIYNYIEVKAELTALGVSFDTESDTEVILRSYEYYGSSFIEKLNGMFAIAIVDHEKNKLFLYRDRLGVKPLFFYVKNGVFAFSSELKTFLKIPGFVKDFDPQAIYHFFNFNYIPLPGTIFKNSFHVFPGSMLVVDLNTLEVSRKTFWDIENSIEVNTPDNEILSQLEDLIEDAVKIRLRSDVPIAAFLSGGLDSSLVCAVAKTKFNYEFETFTVGFHESAYDESIYAKQLCDHLNLKNNVVYMDYSMIKLWDKVTWFNDQPHGDISFIPTYMVAQKAAEKYKVVFSGDGGDEAFGGYLKYLNLLDSNKIDATYFSSISLLDENNFRYEDLFSTKFLKSVHVGSSYELFQSSVRSYENKDIINRGVLFDVKNLLPGNNLVKPDRMAMANSLEVRSPLLDYRIFELMFSLPGRTKISHELGTKHILKKLSLKYLPENLVYRKKQMFTVPVGEWFKHSLNAHLRKHLNDERFLSLGIFNTEQLLKMIDLHSSGEKNYTRELRAVLNLKLWFDEFYFKEI